VADEARGSFIVFDEVTGIGNIVPKDDARSISEEEG
jgi:hypothetical protein